MVYPPARLLALAAIASTFACSAFGGHSTTSPSAGRTDRRIRNYTDSDVIFGIAPTADQIFVATARGVLRYPLAGGAPTRLGIDDGLPDPRVFAISASADGAVWAATPRGVVRYGSERFAPAGDAQPDVGRITAILALEGGNALIGGSQGLAKFDGTHWVLLSNQYQVTAFALDQGRPLVSTAQSGVLALRGDFTTADAYGTQSGIPETLVRSLVPIGANRMWALVQGSGGSKLAYFDGVKWYGYTSERIETSWLALVPYRHGAALIAQGGFYEISQSRGDELIPTDVGTPGGVERVAFSPEIIQPPPPPASSAPPAAATQTSPRHGHARPARHPAGRGRHAPVNVRERTGALAQTSRRGTASAISSSASPTPSSPAPEASSASPGPARPAPRPPINIPAYAPPASAPHEGPHLQAPTFGLDRPASLTLPDDLANAWGEPDGLYIWRIGLGVSRVSGGASVDYRTHDLAMQTRPLSLASDPHDNVWFVTEDGGSARYDGTRFSRVQLDPDPAVVPLLFWSRGTTVAAVARRGPNVVRTYRFAGSGWQFVTDRPIDTGGPGTVDAKFLAVDDHQRYWIGIRVRDQGHAREYGVAVIDEALPATTQFNSQTPPSGAVQGAAPSPDDLTAVDFDAQGTAWFAGLSGATSIALATTPNGTATVHTYNETNGLRGDTVTDLSRGPSDRLYLATPEGLGYWDGTRFGWDIEGSSAMPRVIALASDARGALWGAGPRGAWKYDGSHFQAIGREAGLPSDAFNDLAVDGSNRVWFVTADGISVMSQAAEAATPTGPTGAPSESD